MIQRDFGDGAAFGVRLDYSFDGPKLLGTGGAIKRALPLLGDEFFVLYGDSYLPVEYRAHRGILPAQRQARLHDGLPQSKGVTTPATLYSARRNRGL
jgi:dTDP-glucose pyrophosphorylase